MRRVIQTLAALAGAGAIVAVAVVGLGLYNVSARTSHMPGVTWLLHTTFKQSVRLRAAASEEIPTDIDHPDRVSLGALHYQGACAFCHAAPGLRRNATAMSMNPTPPHIKTATANWQPRQMHWIVHEGVKMSGMPHWPAQGRADEVWSVVAYLTAVSAKSPAAPSALTDDRRSAATCAQCHGENGESGNSFIPRLDILTREQITDALLQYRDGIRASGFMRAATRDLSDAQIEALAVNFGTQVRGAALLGNEDKNTVGGQLATRGTDDVPACTACHGPGRLADAPIAPILAGQSQAYLEQQLRLWRAGTRGGGKRAGLMQKAAQDLKDTDIRTLAAWYAALRPVMEPAKN